MLLTKGRSRFRCGLLFLHKYVAMKPIFILNGPNLNLIGEREPAIYGADTLGSIEARLREQAKDAGFEIVFRQTNHEGVLVDWLQEARQSSSAVILTAGAYTHTSVAILAALRAGP